MNTLDLHRFISTLIDEAAEHTAKAAKSDLELTPRMTASYVLGSLARALMEAKGIHTS